MVSEDNDPDTLQLRDELDADWVNRWCNAANKKKSTTKKITMNVILRIKEPQTIGKIQSKENHRY